MKLSIIAVAIAATLPTVTFAEGLSGFNDARTVNVMCTNVPARSGSVPGFYLENIGYVVEAATADRATTSVVGVMPAGLSSKDEADVRAYLASVGLTNYQLVIRENNRDIIIEEEVIGFVPSIESVDTLVTKTRGVADGSQHERDNLTSTGIAESDGANILRVRSTTDQTVYIRKAGGDTFSIEVGAGDTLVEVPSGGTYVAKFSESERWIVKATGHHSFPDQYGVVTYVETLVPVAETVTRTETYAQPLRWCRGPVR